MSGVSPAERTLGGLTARLTALGLAAFVIVGPLLSLALWSLAERWTYPAAWPQRLGFRYWSRMLTGDFLDPLKTGLVIAVIVTVAALCCAVPLGYALARLTFPGRTLVLLAFLLPQAFPQLPVFAAATREFYRWGLAGTVTGVVLVHLVGGLVFAVWTMTAVFRSIDPSLEEAAHNLGAACASGRPGQGAHLQVTASLETVRGLMGASGGELEFAGPVPTATVQRLACDATITRVVLGTDSAVVDVGRARRLPSGATRKALQVRDRGCAWPNCDRPASWTAAHHVHHWAHGGATDLANLVLLCHRHHWLVHEGGWQLVREQDGALATIPPIPEYRQSARSPDQSAAA